MTGDAVRPEYEWVRLSEQAVIVRFGRRDSDENHGRVRMLAHTLEQNPFQGLIEAVPAIASLTVYYDPASVLSAFPGESPFDTVCSRLRSLMESADFGLQAEERSVRIPVCYGGSFGPDLPYVAETNGLTEQQVIDIHAAGRYPVRMIGFAPGFPYLGGMAPEIAAPRLKEPRVRVPAGSVGIAVGQTGIYPLASPGGWRLIGRTPLALFRPDQAEPSLLRMGDVVQFVPISLQEFEQWPPEPQRTV